jgi:hypothetical protein
MRAEETPAEICDALRHARAGACKRALLDYAVKAKLGRNRGEFALFDTPHFTRYIEEGYRIMWGRAERGLPPASFTVEPRRR